MAATPESTTTDELLTTGEAARLLRSSRQHVVDLCERGDLPYVTAGRHRRIRRDDVDALMSRTERLSRDQIRSLWLGHATAARVVADPAGAFARARRNLGLMREVHRRGGANRWLDAWSDLLEGPIEGVLDALTSRSPRARELRQHSPFAGVLAQAERQRVLRAFTESHPRRPREAE